MLFRTLWSGSWLARLSLIVGLGVSANVFSSIGFGLISSAVSYLIVFSLFVIIVRLLCGR